MIIGIDVSSVAYGTGVSNYTLNLVRHLLKIDHVNQYKLFFSSLRQPLPNSILALNKYSNLKIYRFFIPPTLLDLLWNQLGILPIELFIGKCDVFHTSDWTQPPSTKAKTLTTVHDLVPFLYPVWSHPKIIATHHRKLAKAARHCSAFICVSKSTFDDLVRLFPTIKPNLITIISEAAEDKYNHRPDSKSIAKIKTKYQLDQYLLAQGTREPRKNLTRLIKAFIAFKKNTPASSLQLAIAGKFGWGPDLAKQPDYVKILGYIPETDMLPLHAGAFALIYPSLYEGFGLPLVKALKLGLPIITSNTSSMPEVVDGAALLINPKSTSQIQKAIKKIATDSNLRRSLKLRTKKIAKHYSWTKTAKKTLAVYEKIYQQN